MVGTAVLVIKIIGVFPNVEGQQGLVAAAHGVAGVGLLGDDQLALWVGGEPYPSRAEQAGAFLRELLLEGLEGAELGVDGLGDAA